MQNSEIPREGASTSSPSPKHIIVPPPIVKGVPLERHSLLGRADELGKSIAAATPLLGQVCLNGQATVWFAPANSGKTLIGLALALEAIRAQRVNPGNLYYVNADDSGQGMIDKLYLLQDAGAHMLAPSFAGFKPHMLAEMLTEMAETDKAKGVVVIIDTIKKFSSMMDKREASAFADVCRRFVMHGGTVLGFAHTNKNPGADGKLRYGGTTDLVEDFDAAFILAPFEVEQPDGDRVVMFEAIKRRGDSPEKTAYAFSTANGLTYAELLASVEQVDFDRLGHIERQHREHSDFQMIAMITCAIEKGIRTKMDLAAEVARMGKCSRKAALKVIDRYTGTDPELHCWSFTIGERGKHNFSLLPDSRPLLEHELRPD